MMPLRFTIIVLVAFTYLHSYSQHFVEKNITTLEGLSSNIVVDAMWDKYGYIWISTENGMNRYDGFSVLNFDDNSRMNEVFGHISPIEVVDNKLVYSSLSNELYFIGIDHKVHKMPINKSRLNIHSNWKLLYDFNLIFNKHHSRSEKLNELFHEVQPNNEPIIIDGNHLLFFLKKHIVEYDFTIDSVLKFNGREEDGKLFKLADKTYFFNYSTQKFDEIIVNQNTSELKRIHFPVSLPHYIEKICWRNGMNYMVLLGQGTIYYVDDKFQLKLIAKTNLDVNNIYSVKYNLSTEETLVSTSNNGIVIYCKSPIGEIKNSHLNTRNPVMYLNSHIEIEPNVIWGTKNTMFTVGDSVFKTSTDVPLFRSAFKANDSIVLFQMMNKSLASFNTKRKTYNLYTSIPPSEFYTSAFCCVGNKCFNVSRYGIVEIENERDTFIYRFKAPQNPNFAKDVAVVSSEKILIGGGKGLFEYQLKSHQLKFLNSPTLLDVNSIRVYGGYVFLCTYGQGLWLYHKGKFHQVSYDKFKYLQYVHSVFIDQHKVAWISTNNALLQTTFDNLIHTVTREYQHLNCIVHDKTNYFPIEELNGATQGNQILLSNGDLSLVGMKGFMQVGLGSRVKNNDEPIIAIDKILDDAKNEFIENGNSFEVKNSSKSIRFFISSPTRTITHGQLLQYKLHNYSSNWATLDLEKTNHIEFQNLHYGNYTLEIIKDDVITGKSYSKTINFSVEIPWYLKWWVVLCWIFSLGLIVLLYLRWKTKKLQLEKRQLEIVIDQQTSEIKHKNLELEVKIEQLEDYQEKLESNYAIKNKLIGVITHDLITPLSFINSNSLNLLKNVKDRISDEHYERIKSISDSSFNMFKMSSNLIEWIKLNSSQMIFNSEEFDLNLLVNEICQTLLPLTQGKALKLLNRVENKNIVASKKALHILLFQIITNAIKYSEKGNVVISSNEQSGKMVIEVSDEGVGFPLSLHCEDATRINVFLRQSERGFGLFIINDLLEVLHATISIGPNGAVGTSIRVAF